MKTVLSGMVEIQLMITREWTFYKQVRRRMYWKQYISLKAITKDC